MKGDVVSKNEFRTISDIPGHAALTRFRAHGGGMELFRAYVERRAADQQHTQDKQDRLKEQLDSQDGLPMDEFWEALTELLRCNILNELDVVIGDILDFCENQPSGDEQLVALRDALKIGRFHAPIDSRRTETKWQCEMAWIELFRHRQDAGVFMTVDAMATEIANKIGISKTTALNHWEARTSREPWQKQWADYIHVSTKPRKLKISKPPRQKMKPMKPKSWR